VTRAIIDAVHGHGVLIDVDSYYRPLDYMSPAERERVNFDHPDTIEPKDIIVVEGILTFTPLARPRGTARACPSGAGGPPAGPRHVIRCFSITCEN